MVKVIKRDGRKTEFNGKKIRVAVLKAFEEVDGEITPEAETKADDIVAHISKLNESVLSVEKIQDIVEEKLMASKRKDVAKAFIIYRNDRTKSRELNSRLIKSVKEKLFASNIENQNANMDEKSFGGRIGAASDAVMKQYALDYCMSDVTKSNHLNNEIYIHDLNHYAVGTHNCYNSDVAFITYDGVKKFKELCDGQNIRVIDKNGMWRNAVVRKYGKQKMYDLTFTAGATKKTITCTRNHRWVLADGTITDNIQVGDKLLLTPALIDDFELDEKLWCFGFVLGDGCDKSMKSKDKQRVTNGTMQVRLCGEKSKYLEKFIKCGWSIGQRLGNGDVVVISRGNGSYKQVFLENKLWKIMSHNDICNIFNGYLCADGHINNLTASTSDNRIKEFIEYSSGVAGYYLLSQKTKINDTEYKNNRVLHEFKFIKKQSSNHPWRLESIRANRNGENGYQIAWCVEEPMTNTFTLDGGMVTGNCLSIPFDKLLANGFNTRQTDVRPAQSVSTAFQLVAVIFQLQSLQQFGGVSATHLDWTMVPYVRKSFYKHFRDGLKYIEHIECDNKPIEGACIESEVYRQYPEAYQYAIDKTEREVYQAVEGMYHNLNTLQSRSGNQLPFTSINYGTCTEPEGRMVTKALLDVSIKGIGKLRKTSIFPCGIFQCMNGINRKPGDPNYDLFQLALRSTAQRLYPNYANIDWSGNDGYDKNDPKTFFSTMGCVDGHEIITYNFKGNLYVESFERMWDRLANYFIVREQYENSPHLYMCLSNVKIYDTKQGFVETKKIIRNLSDDWVDVHLSNGRRLLCTTDHPFEVINHGVVHAYELKAGYSVMVNSEQYSENNIGFNCDRAWFLGFMLCDGCYQSNHVFASIAATGENDIEDKFINIVKNEFDLDVNAILQQREKKGIYKDLCIKANKYNGLQKLIMYLTEKFEGINKAKRHIPNEVFSWKNEAKLSFLGGMIDADGYINAGSHGGCIVQIGSTNKELALQQMALAQSLGMPAKMYHNHYSKVNPNLIRYRVEFKPSEILLPYICCKKKLDNYIKPISDSTNSISEIIEITPIEMGGYSYDVETDSSHFEVSGIYSHNCRTANGYDVNGFGQLKDGRGNICPVTIILPTLAMETIEECNQCVDTNVDERDYVDRFMNLLDKKIHEAKDMLLERFEWICSQSSESAKFMYENEVMEGYIPEEGIKSALKHGTLAVGQIGLAETLQILIGFDHTTEKGMELAKRIEQLFKDRCAEFKEQYKLNFGVYYTPAENLCFTAMIKFKEKYGEIPNVSDKDFFTNSIHVPVWKDMKPTEKIDIESQLTGYSSAGCITYVELDGSVKNNISALESIVNYAMDKDIPYFAVNVPNDTCTHCGYCDDINEKCPMCGCTDIRRLRRVTGYLTGDYKTAFNKGKQQEVTMRVKHEKF